MYSSSSDCSIANDNDDDTLRTCSTYTPLRFNFKRRKLLCSSPSHTATSYCPSSPRSRYSCTTSTATSSFLFRSSSSLPISCIYLLLYLIVFCTLLSSDTKNFCDCQTIRDHQHLSSSFNSTTTNTTLSPSISSYPLTDGSDQNKQQHQILPDNAGSSGHTGHGRRRGHHVFTDQFVLHMDAEPDEVRRIAEKHGFDYLDHVIDNYYHLKHRKVVKRSLQPSHHLTSEITDHPAVNSVTQLKLKRRLKRDLVKLHPLEGSRGKCKFDDPKWQQMWYLNRGQGLDMNVQKVWEMNITGRGVVVTILDDGLEGDHPDLIENYDPRASYDVNNQDDDPSPRYDIIDSNRHGTRCAGEVAASANNSNCAVGVAYHAKVGGVRMLDGDVTDAVEARSLSLNPQHIHIYSASWGPDDDGKTVDGPGELATKAFMSGVAKGRNGLGSIFIWASGNGGREHDNCNCDGYTNSIWTLSISSATENGLVPWYSEACSSTLATTYSSGSFGERQIVTTDLHHGCTSTHTGTSASAPLAAGIAALALEANPKLTWRDMQHIVVLTAKPANLHAKDWKTNGVGRNVSHSFGYGLMDAEAMVKVAKEWVTVPSQKVCEVRFPPFDKAIPAKSSISVPLKVTCDDVRYLEHVQANVTLTATRRGDIHIYLTSPAKTRSNLLAQRPMDNSRAGFNHWPFMSVHTWGENPNGEWSLEIHNEARFVQERDNLPSLLARAYLKGWSLTLYGTSESPDRRRMKSESLAPSPVESVPNAVEDDRSRKASSSSASDIASPTRFSPSREQAISAITKGPINPPLAGNHLPESEREAISPRISSEHLNQGSGTGHGVRANKPGDFDKSSKTSASINGCRLSAANSQCLEGVKKQAIRIKDDRDANICKGKLFYALVKPSFLLAACPVIMMIIILLTTIIFMTCLLIILIFFVTRSSSPSFHIIFDCK
ncbi:proprotein convertase subtilisin/kexin type 4-like isoform X3 [Brevipalpus obovatus]|uniref:proprotein convertase subtilisin/kexin type 4-like isoform X3 n=1 Tax=Brevipalpus obovatus TaxID=246614 RepID=UPI003D9DD3DD